MLGCSSTHIQLLLLLELGGTNSPLNCQCICSFIVEYDFCNQATCAVLPWGQIYNSALYSALSLIVELPLLAAGAGCVYLGKYTALCVTVRLLWHRAWKPEYGCESHRATPAVVWMEADKTDEKEKHGIWTNTLSPTRSRGGRNCKHYFFHIFFMSTIS